MNLISWNCNMAFRRKWQYLLPYSPDIMVIQECEHVSKYKPADLIPVDNQFIWHGENLNKGIGIIALNGYQIKISDNYRKKYKYIIPIKVTRPAGETFNLFAIWAMSDKVKAKSYVGQVWAAVKYYKKNFSEDTILIGDFNSNQIWDTERKKGNHTDCVNLFAKHNIESIYHRQTREAHGSESTPTIYLLKQLTKPFHLDYCFASQSIIKPSTKISIGTPEKWLTRSDHMPLIIDDLT